MMPLVKFIGGPIDGQLHELPELPPRYRVPVPPKGAVCAWARGGDFDPNSAPDIKVEEYRLYRLTAGNFYLHGSVNAKARLEAEAMEWPETVGA